MEEKDEGKVPLTLIIEAKNTSESVKGNLECKIGDRTLGSIDFEVVMPYSDLPVTIFSKNGHRIDPPLTTQTIKTVVPEMQQFGGIVMPPLLKAINVMDPKSKKGGRSLEDFQLYVPQVTPGDWEIKEKRTFDVPVESIPSVQAILVRLD